MTRAALGFASLLLAVAGCSSRDPVADYDGVNAGPAADADPPASIDDALEWGNRFACPQGCREPQRAREGRSRQ